MIKKCKHMQYYKYKYRKNTITLAAAVSVHKRLKQTDKQ